MAGPTRPPLGTLEALRRRAVEDARARLAEAIAAGELLRARMAAAERALVAARQRLAAAESPVAPGPAGGLAGEERWRARLQGGVRVASDEVAGCAEALRRAAAGEAGARDALAAAERRLEAVRRHRERWAQERRRRVEAAEEAEQDDRARGAPEPQGRT